MKTSVWKKHTLERIQVWNQDYRGALVKKFKKRLHSRCFPTTFVNFFSATILKTPKNIQDSNLVLSWNTCFCWLSIKLHFPFIVLSKNVELKHFFAKLVLWEVRSSHRRCSVKKGVLKYFANFTWKHLCRSDSLF